MFGAELNLIPSRPNDKNGSNYPSQGRQFGLGGWLTVHTSRPAVLSPGTVRKTILCFYRVKRYLAPPWPRHGVKVSP